MFNDEMLEKLKFLACNRSFLGREFLTWLIYGISRGYHYDLDIKLHVDGKITVAKSGGHFSEITIKGGTPEYTANLRSALTAGALVSSIRVCMESKDPAAPRGSEGGLYSWTMDAADLSPKSMKVPSVMEASAAAHACTRASHLDYVMTTIDRLFNLYLETRLNPEKLEQFKGAFTAWASWDGEEPPSAL
jgi:hypothetical protein